MFTYNYVVEAVRGTKSIYRIFPPLQQPCRNPGQRVVKAVLLLAINNMLLLLRPCQQRLSSLM